MPRKPQPQFTMCQIFRELWELERGGKYFVSTLDLKHAYEFYCLNGELGKDEMRPYFKNYLSAEFEGWEKMGFPAWQFFKHFMSFAPREKKVEVVRKRSTYHCPKCDMDHPISEPCPPKNVTNLIQSISRAM